ncbi:hypothetical protein [Chroococcidiopsis sp.]|uniref:hypothetical protein n=1 Tax=Chroococcidiopsis sp. TaxID=3088168 RepID=UPI003F2FE1D3
MALYFLEDLRRNFISNDVVYDWELPIVEDDHQSFSAMAIQAMLPVHIAQPFDALSKVLGVTFDNCGKIQYSSEDGALKYVGFPSIGMFEGSPHLKVGDTFGTDYSATYIPLQHDGSDYMIQGNKLEFNRVQTENGERASIKLKIKGGDTFFISFRMVKDSSLDAVESAFDNGEFGQYLNSFSSVYANATKMFFTTFKSGSFPKEGVLFKLGNGKLRETEYSGKTISSVSFAILACSHPDLIVQDTTKDDPKLVEISQVSSISFSQSTHPYSLFSQGSVSASDVLYCHFQCAAVSDGEARLDWTPKHIASKVPSRLPLMSRNLLPLVGEDAPATLPSRSAKPALAAVPDVQPAKRKKAEVVSDESPDQAAKSADLSQIPF